MKRQGYPFAAACQLEKVQKAILLALINPHAGGLLVSGEKGTGKSTLARSARELTDRPWLEVPISITEDRLFGSIDAEEAIRSGHKKLLPGLIDEADGGLLYIDDVNLLRDDLLSAILSIQEAGGYRLERDGLSEQRQTRFTVLAVMAPESGTLSSASLDHFGMFVSADAAATEEDRMEIIRRVTEYERDSKAFREKWQPEMDALREKISEARNLLPAVEVSDAMVRLAAVYTLKANVAGHRADIFLIEAARSLAALAGRKFILPKDLEEAAEFVLPHRMRQLPPEAEAPAEPQAEAAPSQTEPEKPAREETFSQPDSPQPPSPIDTEEHEGNMEEKTPPEEMANPNASSSERVDAADTRVLLPPVWIEPPGSRQMKKGSGKRSATKTDLRQGRYVRAGIPKGRTTDIAFDATLRAAAPFQRVRESNGCAVVIRPEDMRSKIREKRTGNIFIFAVDASGSMGARERMKTVKGVIFKILLEAYQKRDRVSMIAFRKNQAEVLLPVTRSVDFAQKKLASMPTGGKTPLAKGLRKTEDLLDMIYRQDPAQDPVLILITDGRATRALNPEGDPVQEAIIEAKRIGRRQLPIAVIDTENGFVKLGLAKRLARAMAASYFPVDRITEDQLLHIWRSTAARA